MLAALLLSLVPQAEVTRADLARAYTRFEKVYFAARLEPEKKRALNRAYDEACLAYFGGERRKLLDELERLSVELGAKPEPPAPEVPPYDWDGCRTTMLLALSKIESRSPALEQALATAHSRLLVCRGSVDGLVGVVGLRDLVAATHGDPPATIAPLARTAHVVPETKDLGVLLRKLREAHQSLAVIVNEYGLTEGVVSIEDILEEIVGEIEDEYDLPDPTVTWIDDRTVAVAGSLTIDDFNETMGTELPQEGARTLAGLVFTHLGRQPVVGDELVAAGVELRVAEVDRARITRLRIVLPQASARRAPRADPPA